MPISTWMYAPNWRILYEQETSQACSTFSLAQGVLCGFCPRAWTITVFREAE